MILIEKITFDNFLKTKLKCFFEQYHVNFESQQDNFNKYSGDCKILNSQLVELECENSGLKQKLQNDESMLNTLLEENDEHISTSNNKIGNLELIISQIHNDKKLLKNRNNDLSDKVKILEDEKEGRENTKNF